MARLRRLLVVALAAAACGGGMTTAGPPAPSPPAVGATPAGANRATAGAVTVLAASSLTDAFEQVSTEFEAAHPDVSVNLSFAGSQRLATQIVQGAPADVFASASPQQMEVAVTAGQIAGPPEPMAGNRLAIAVEPGNPRGIGGLHHLDRATVNVVLSGEDVPAGRYARDALDRAGVAVTPVSLEADVRGVLTKVALGEADAGIVYASDIVAAGDAVEGIAIPDPVNVVARYPIAVVADGPNPAAARVFVDHVRSEAGQVTLARFGFSPP